MERRKRARVKSSIRSFRKASLYSPAPCPRLAVGPIDLVTFQLSFQKRDQSLFQRDQIFYSNPYRSSKLHPNDEAHFCDSHTPRISRNPNNLRKTYSTSIVRTQTMWRPLDVSHQNPLSTTKNETDFYTTTFTASTERIEKEQVEFLRLL